MNDTSLPSSRGPTITRGARSPGECTDPDVRGDPDELAAQLFRDHQPALLRYAVRRVGPDAAPDVVSAVFAVVLPRLHQVPADPLPWLYAVAYHEVLKEGTRRARANRLHIRLRVRAGPGGSHGTVPDVSDVVVNHAWAQDLLKQLRPADAELLRLVVWDDLNVTTAAAVLGISVGAAHVRLHRLRKRVAVLLHAGGPVLPHPLGRINPDERCRVPACRIHPARPGT